jgi:hypothetical protein
LTAGNRGVQRFGEFVEEMGHGIELA